MSKILQHRQPWLREPFTEVCFIILPPFLCLLLIALFPYVFQNAADMPVGWWVILILLVDVAHVYSTLYKTYFDKNAVARHKTLFQVVPVIALAGTILLYTTSVFWFWRILAYLAVFHFVRQQYGFMRIYSREETYNNYIKLFDKFVIYYATVYPILYWHLHPDRNFNWFMDGDFWQYQSFVLLHCCTILYWIMITAFILKEIYIACKYGFVNIPRLSIVTGTIVSWYFGIVYYNGDMAFTLLNVVSHGIPYMALVWLTGKSASGRKTGVLQFVYGKFGWVLFLVIIFCWRLLKKDCGTHSCGKNTRRYFLSFIQLPLTATTLC